MRMRLTDLSCKNARTSKATGENFWDTKTEGLLLRVLTSGSKTFYFKYRSPLRRVPQTNGRSVGRQISYRIGAYGAVTLEEARRIALQLAAEVASRKDPAAERKTQLIRAREANTFNELADQWLEEHARPHKAARATRDDESMLNRHVRSAIGALKASEVTRDDIRRVVASVTARGTMVRANRVLELVRAIYRWGIAEKRVVNDPTTGIKRPHDEQPRDRVLGDEEIRKVWWGVPGAGGTATIESIIRMELLLGLRTAEIAKLARTEIELDALPPRLRIVREHSKNKRAHFVPLPNLAVQIVREAIARAGDSPWLFPSPQDPGRHVYQHIASRFLTDARDQLGVLDFNTHDLRRTMATYLDDELEIGVEEIKRVLNHVDAVGATGHYIHPKKLRKKMRVLEAWAEYLSVMLAQPTGSIVVASKFGGS